MLAIWLLGPGCHPYLVLLVIDMLPLVINLNGQLFNPPLQFSVGRLQSCLLPKRVWKGVSMAVAISKGTPAWPPLASVSSSQSHHTGKDPGQIQRTRREEVIHISEGLQLSCSLPRKKVPPKDQARLAMSEVQDGGNLRGEKPRRREEGLTSPLFSL